MSERVAADNFGAGKGIINRLKREGQAVENAGQGALVLKKRKLVDVKPRYEKLENTIVELLELMKERRIPVTRPMLREIAK